MASAIESLTLVILLVILGGALWTLFEYVVHGILSHRFNTPVSPMHWGHHLQLQRIFTPALAWLPVSIAITAMLIVMFGWLVGISLSAGMLLGFVHYEYCHWRIHFREPLTARQQLLRDHHLAHHFRNPKAYFGISTIFWDKVFGSLPGSFADDYRYAKGCHPLAGPGNDGHKKAD